MRYVVKDSQDRIVGVYHTHRVVRLSLSISKDHPTTFELYSDLGKVGILIIDKGHRLEMEEVKSAHST